MEKYSSINTSQDSTIYHPYATFGIRYHLIYVPKIPVYCPTPVTGVKFEALYYIYNYEECV